MGYCQHFQIYVLKKAVYFSHLKFTFIFYWLDDLFHICEIRQYWVYLFGHNSIFSLFYKKKIIEFADKNSDVIMHIKLPVSKSQFLMSNKIIYTESRLQGVQLQRLSAACNEWLSLCQNH